MSRRLSLLIIAVTVVSGALFVRAITSYDLGPDISLTGHAGGQVIGLGFWVGLTLVASALPVRLPAGSLVDVSFAPLVAALSLGGAPAAAWVGLIGTTQARELRRSVPWYGVLANHAAMVSPAILSALFLGIIPGRDRNQAVDLLATVAAGFCYFAVNISLNAAFESLLHGPSITRVVRSNAGALVNLLALAPIAWLMAQMYHSAGWWAVLLFALPLYTTRLAYQRFVEVREMFTQTVRSLAEAVDKRDKFTSGHSHRVQEIALDIGRVLKLGDEDLEALEWGGLLHDIGKIGVPDAVLLKQERLTRDERAVMNSHPVLGAEIIAPVRRLAPELPIIRHHHEWFNGSGYPDRLVADEIPRLARILHVADAFEAMTAIRPYRMTPLTQEQALGELRKFGGIQFDPDVVEAFEQTKWAKAAEASQPEARNVPMFADAVGALAVTRGDDGGRELSVSDSGTATTAAPA